MDYLLGRGVYGLSSEAQQYAKQFDELPVEKKTVDYCIHERSQSIVKGVLNGH